MSLYIRKILMSKWKPKSPLPPNLNYLAIGTDGVTNCCKTDGNTISLWRVDSEELVSVNDKKVISTLATNGGSLSPIDCIFMTDEEIKELGLVIEQTEGFTLIPEIKGLHFDIRDLNLDSLSRLGYFINVKVAGVSANATVITKPKTKRIAINTIKDCVKEFIPKDSEQGQALLLKTGFSKVYN